MSDIIDAISRLDECEQVAELRRAPRCVRELLKFCYGNHALDLPTTKLKYDVIPTEAYSEAPELGDEDIVAREAPKMRTLFAVGAHATLTSERRLSLWRDIMERATHSDRTLLDAIRTTRTVPGISRETAEWAFPGIGAETPRAPEPAQEPTYDFRTEPDGDAPRVLEQVAAQEPSRPPTANELRYAALMARMGW